MLTADERSALAQVKATYPEVERWGARTGTLCAEPGSSIAKDDELLPWWHLSQAATLGLSYAIHHLRAARLLLDGRELFPTVYATLARTAIVAAAQVGGPRELAHLA